MRARTVPLLWVVDGASVEEGLKRMSGSRRKKKATGMNNKAKVFYCTRTQLWMERGGWIRRADGQEKGDGSGQKASGIGCRGDEKRMPNHSRPFGLAGPFPPAPLPLPLGRQGEWPCREAQSGSRNPNERAVSSVSAVILPGSGLTLSQQ